MTTSIQHLTMYDLAALRHQLEAVVAEQDGELRPDQETLWDAIDGRFEEKVENTVLLAREKYANADAVKAEATRLSKLAKSLEAEGDRLESLALDRMQFYGKAEVNGLLVKVKVAKSTPAVHPLVPLDEEVLRGIRAWAPFAVRHTPEQFALDKDGIKAHAKAAGLDADLAKYVKIEQGVRLSVR